jgi:hypothetical protein
VGHEGLERKQGNCERRKV